MKDNPLTFRMRWAIVWRTEDDRGRVQRYNVFPGFNLYDAWYDRRFLGQSHRQKQARDLVRAEIEKEERDG